MKTTLARLTFSTHLFICLCCVPSYGRPPAALPYDELVAESDIVAIIEPLENQPTKDTFLGYSYGHSTNDFVATNTRFKVQVVLKARGESPKELTVLHFGYSTNVLILDGACFVRFFIGPFRYEERAFKDGKPVGGVTMVQQPT